MLIKLIHDKIIKNSISKYLLLCNISWRSEKVYIQKNIAEFIITEEDIFAKKNNFRINIHKIIYFMIHSQ